MLEYDIIPTTMSKQEVLALRGLLNSCLEEMLEMDTMLYILESTVRVHHGMPGARAYRDDNGVLRANWPCGVSYLQEGV